MNEPTAILTHAIAHWQAEPEIEIEDAYKWLYHATLGGEHAVLDDAGPRRWMDREWQGLGELLPGEPDLVKLRPDGQLIRVNLRPYKAAGGDKETLLQVFVASARRFHAARSAFEAEWFLLGETLREDPIGRLTRAEWDRVDEQTKAAGYPAIEHSKAYLEARIPAYRVVLAELWS